jgi:6-phosphogluconolactonase
MKKGISLLMNMKCNFLVAVMFVSVNCFSQEHYLLTGTYDSPKSEGIYVYRFNSVSGNAVPVSFFKTSNASFLSVSPDEKFVFAVNERSTKDGKGGEVIALAFNKQNGLLTQIDRKPSGGDNPCHIELDRSGRWLFVSNYSSGTLSVIRVNADGTMGEPVALQHTGAGKDPQRQKSPHVHGAFISPDNKQLLVTDLGIDKVMLYDFNATTGKLNPSKQKYIASVAGSGPRSLYFDGPGKKVFVIEELSGSFSIYKYRNHQLKKYSRVLTNEKGDSSFSGNAHIALSADRKFLYTSSRAEINKINIYSNEKNSVHFIDRQPVLGKGPRYFSIDPSQNWLLSANQNSDQIVIFKRDKKNGNLTDSGNRINVGKPVCIKWININ